MLCATSWEACFPIWISCDSETRDSSLLPVTGFRAHPSRLIAAPLASMSERGPASKLRKAKRRDIKGSLGFSIDRRSIAARDLVPLEKRTLRFGERGGCDPHRLCQKLGSARQPRHDRRSPTVIGV